MQRQPSPPHSQAVPQKQKTETLWLVTCETREGAKDITNWHVFASAVKRNHELQSTRRQQQHSQHSQHSQQQVHNTKVEVRNICGGKPWQGLLSKMQYMTTFLDGFLNSTYTTNTNTANDDSNSNNEEHTHVIAFMDSDVIFNVWGVSIAQVLERYHVARQNMPILIGAEPSCWHGRKCSPPILEAMYPETASNRSSCPRYVNSGTYMGEPQALRDMLQQLLFNNLEGSGSALEQKMRRFGMNPANDQGRMLAWYGLHGRGKVATLDTRAMVFRNMFYGYINASAPGGWTCGGGALSEGLGHSLCGTFATNTPGHVDENYAMVYDKVPGCGPAMDFSMAKETKSVANYYETTPFIIHSNGPTKRANIALMQTVRARIEEQIRSTGAK